MQNHEQDAADIIGAFREGLDYSKIGVQGFIETSQREDLK